MKDDGKLIQFGNFNVTFFEDNEDKPMLSHFEDIIYPAFNSNIERKMKSGIYSLIDVSIQEVDGEIVLAGCLIKNTKYEVYTTMENGSLEFDRHNVLTCPFSKFVIFLRNHRMVLVKNEKNSPDLRSFNSSIGYIINEFIRNENKRRKNNKVSPTTENLKPLLLPSATVNIVGLPKDSQSIIEKLDELKKVKRVVLRFFPLNNDIDTTEFTKAIRQMAFNTDTKNSSFILNSPKKNIGVANLLTQTEGTVAANVEGITKDGEKVNIKSNDIAMSTYLPCKDNLMDYSIAKIVSFVRKAKVKLVTSNDNNSIYESFLERIKKLL